MGSTRQGETTLGMKGRAKARRSYLPKVEALEALRLLDAAPAGIGTIIAQTASIAAPSATPLETGHDTWDAALDQTRLADLLSDSRPVVADDPAAMASGLSQLDRYLARTWSRAGVAPQ